MSDDVSIYIFRTGTCIETNVFGHGQTLGWTTSRISRTWSWAPALPSRRRGGGRSRRCAGNAQDRTTRRPGAHATLAWWRTCARERRLESSADGRPRLALLIGGDLGAISSRSRRTLCPAPSSVANCFCSHGSASYSFLPYPIGAISSSVPWMDSTGSEVGRLGARAIESNVSHMNNCAVGAVALGE